VVNGSTASSVTGKSVSSYTDREAVLAGGASWFTRTSPSTQEDIAAYNGHIYLGSKYCHYGVNSNAQSCGTITKVDVLISDASGNTYTTQSTALCKQGDSGGPVWKPLSPASIPVGLIIGGDQTFAPDTGSRYPCRYVSLDDQLLGTGWTLL
jgi:hypothetical protein